MQIPKEYLMMLNERVINSNELSKECFIRADDNGSTYWKGRCDALIEIIEELTSGEFYGS